MVMDVRWKQRFENFDRAHTLLREALSRGGSSLSQLEREGTIHRFEYTFELAWKLMKDYLEHAGVAMPTLTPRAIIEAALAAGIIREGHVWTDMLRQRNLLTHSYNVRHSDDALQAIEGSYLAQLAQLHAWLTERLRE
jgi:nucleotidyltransferase substrate binding protein (TIGR01987 family)